MSQSFTCQLQKRDVIFIMSFYTVFIGMPYIRMRQTGKLVNRKKFCPKKVVSSKKKSSLGISLKFFDFCPKTKVFFKQKRVFTL